MGMLVVDDFQMPGDPNMEELTVFWQEGIESLGDVYGKAKLSST